MALLLRLFALLSVADAFLIASSWPCRSPALSARCQSPLASGPNPISEKSTLAEVCRRKPCRLSVCAFLLTAPTCPHSFARLSRLKVLT